ncbi:MAG: FAA hydrolase family protein [Rhodobacteraceae bacterium]|nr:FAA hydrolase family protein [Paracoccaceae bacterium]
MKLVRYGTTGQEKPGMIDADGTLRDLSAHVADITGATLGDDSIAKLRALDPATLPTVDGNPRMGACVGDIGKFMCIGLNYADHAAETGADIPEHPILFMKANSAITGPNDDVVMPRGSATTDWEVELGVVIGTRDEVEDPQNLDMWLDVNGKRMQTGNTKTMIFTVAQVISHLSQLFTLHPGDVISTGTPPGVGMGIKPEPVYLKDGDVMELSIQGLGMQRQNVRADD